MFTFVYLSYFVFVGFILSAAVLSHTVRYVRQCSVQAQAIWLRAQDPSRVAECADRLGVSHCEDLCFAVAIAQANRRGW